jgi:hypothetical protein
MFSHRAGVSALHSVKPCFYAQFGRFRRSRSATWRQSRESHPADQLASLVNEVFRYREYRTPLFIGVRGISFRVHSRIASFHSRIMCELTPELLNGHVTFRSGVLDRLYLNGYVGALATAGGLVTFHG